MMSLKSTFNSTCTLASAISSLQRNSRRGVPVPQRTTRMTGDRCDIILRTELFPTYSLLTKPAIPKANNPIIPNPARHA